MNINSNFIHHGTINTSHLKHLISELPNDSWNTKIAELFPNHKDCKSIFFINNIKPIHYYGKIHTEFFNPFHDALEPIFNHLHNSIGKGYIIRAQLTRHEAGKGFGRHRDRNHKSVTSSHRIHIPIYSNDKTWFEVENERRIMHEGEVIEINNTRLHEGRNEGDTKRINLLIDYAHNFSPLERLNYFLALDATIGINGKLLARPKIDEDQFDIPSFDNIESTEVSQLGHIISINYEIYNSQSGKLIEKDDTDEPLSFMLGARQIPHALEKALINLKVGDSVNLTLKPEEGYGPVNKKLRKKNLYKEEVPVAESVEKDGVIFLQRNFTFGKFLIHDYNHWFAGLNLFFSIKIKNIRKPTLLEYEFGTYTGASFNIQNLPD